MEIRKKGVTRIIPINSSEPFRERSLEEIVEEIMERKSYQIKPGNITNRAVKQRHIEAEIIFRGLAADRPNGSTHVKAYFATDTGTLSIWDGSAWVDIPRIPSSPQTYTPTNVTTDRSYDADTALVAEVADVLGTLIADLQAIGVIN